MISSFPNIPGRYLSFITTDQEELAFVHCAGYLRTREYYKAPILVQVPYEWYEPEFQGEEAFKKWEYHINLIGGKVEYKGIGPYKGKSLTKDVVSNFNKRMLPYSYNTKRNGFDDKSFISEDKWVYWEISNELSHMNLVYYTFCLVRYLYARHLCRIVSVFYELRKALPKIQCFKLIQLAHHSYDESEHTKGFGIMYNGTWTIMNNQLRLLREKEEGIALLKNVKDPLHNIHPGTPMYDGREAIRTLILNKQYKKAYDELKG